MIEYLKGEIAELTPTRVVIECHGVGYESHITLNTYAALEKLKETKLYIYEIIREDTHQLFGFSEKRERSLFLLLISVSGIGGNTARMILSALSCEELCQTIASGNETILKSIKGIGLKTAQRIIIELRDKISNLSDLSSTLTTSSSGNLNQESVTEAIAALTMLGFPQNLASKAVQQVHAGEPGATVEMLIKAALKIL